MRASTSPRVAYGYCRVSTADQARPEGAALKGISIEAQKDGIQRYFDYRLADTYQRLEIIEDAGSSAEKVDLLKRPEGSRLPGLLKRGDCVVVTRMDRGFRNPADLARTLELWDKQGIILHLLDVNMDTSTATGKLIAYIMSAVAQWENSMRRDRVLAANEKRRAEGLPVGAVPPLGFKIVLVRNKQGNLERKFATDHEWRAWAQKIVQLRHHGYTDYRGKQIVGPSFEQIAVHLLYQKFELPGAPEINHPLLRRWYLRELELQAADEARRERKQDALDSTPPEPV